MVKLLMHEVRYHIYMRERARGERKRERDRERERFKLCIQQVKN